MCMSINYSTTSNINPPIPKGYEFMLYVKKIKTEISKQGTLQRYHIKSDL